LIQDESISTGMHGLGLCLLGSGVARLMSEIVEWNQPGSSVFQ